MAGGLTCTNSNPSSIPARSPSSARPDARGRSASRSPRTSSKGSFPGPSIPSTRGPRRFLASRRIPPSATCPEPVDAAVYCVPADKVLDVARQCAKAGVKGHIVITSGFARDRQQEGRGRAGPDRQGLGRPGHRAEHRRHHEQPRQGQRELRARAPVQRPDGAHLAVGRAHHRPGHRDLRPPKFGVSSMISLGNMADVDFADCIEYYAQDPNTKCIALYIEGVKNGFKFMQAGRWAGKPIVALKAGVSAHGAAAAASHTGSLAGSVKVYQAACKQAHMIWATDLEDMLNKSQALAMQPVLKGGQRRHHHQRRRNRRAGIGRGRAARHPAPDGARRRAGRVPEVHAGLRQPQEPGGHHRGQRRGRLRGGNRDGPQVPLGRRHRRLLLRDGRHQGHGHRQRRHHQAEGDGSHRQAGGSLLRGRRGQRGGGQGPPGGLHPVLRLPQQDHVRACGASPGRPLLRGGLQGGLRAVRRRGQEAGAGHHRLGAQGRPQGPDRARGQGHSSPATACR